MMRGISLRTCTHFGRRTARLPHARIGRPRAGPERTRAGPDRGHAALELTLLAALLIASHPVARAQTTQSSTPCRVFVSNERSGDVTVIVPANRSVIATIPVGTRPRGIHP